LSPYHSTLRPDELFTEDTYVNVNICGKDRTVKHAVAKVIKKQKTKKNSMGLLYVVESGLIEFEGHKIITDILPINGAFYIKESEPQILKPERNP
jgi:hypothetical protein